MTSMKKIVKYWLFYLREEYIDKFNYLLTPKYEHDEPGVSGYFNLYAYTDREKYKKEFCKNRDMSKFILKEKDLDANEIHHLAEDFKYGYLGSYKITTRTKFDVGSVDVICTEGEYQMTSMYSSFYDTNPQKLLPERIPVEIFKDEYKELFDLTGVTYLSSAISGDVLMSNKYCPFVIDLLFVYLDLFGNLMKGD